jgi:hypothetical protein
MITAVRRASADWAALSGWRTIMHVPSALRTSIPGRMYRSHLVHPVGGRNRPIRSHWRRMDLERILGTQHVAPQTRIAIRAVAGGCRKAANDRWLFVEDVLKAKHEIQS